MTDVTKQKYAAPWVRVGLLILGTLIVAYLARRYTGSVIPEDPKDALIFQNALLLIVLGSALLEHHFTKPADAVVNSLMGLITLTSVFGVAPKPAWYFPFSYCALVFVVAAGCVAASSSGAPSGWQRKLAQFTYRPAVVFGRARVLFTVVFISGLWFFSSVQDPQTIALVLFWGLFISLWPLKIPELITSWTGQAKVLEEKLGTVNRIDNPNIIRTVLAPNSDWSTNNPKVCVLPDGSAFWTQPLFSQFQEGHLLGTGLLTNLKANAPRAEANGVFEASAEDSIPTSEEINEALGGGSDSQLVGFVVERSKIGTVRFETLNADQCHSGMLVWATVAGRPCYYQIVEGETSEESFSSDKHGFRIATATQLGALEESEGFKKVEWLPAMNTPVFAAKPDSPLACNTTTDNDFVLGIVPNSQIAVGGNFLENYNHHTALLGVTGSGKTELAFDLIRHSVAGGMKVVCIDLTAQYAGRLGDLNPEELSISQTLSDELSQKLFDVETGPYGAGNEKKALQAFADELREEVSERITGFLENDQGSNLGLIQLQELANTKATLWITELYMTCLLKYAKEHIGNCPKILIVVEEAHTVMPEPNSMGLGDFDSKGLVGKIGQIALQGRKYGVGLLVLAQRTATVSKMVLTQCNTVISFTCYDETSLGFLKNIYGQSHIELIPNLRPLHAIALGKWVKSEQPIVFEIPYDERKSAV